MEILYLGDIMGEPGIEAVKQYLPELKKQADLIIAQAENVSDGKGMLSADMRRLQKLGVDFFTGGNHTPRRPELHKLLENADEPVIGPANMTDCPGPGWKYIDTPKGRVLIVSILGKTLGNHQPETTNPLQAVDKILADNQDTVRAATIINFHGDFSSEKRVIGYYLDGRVTAVIGDHWHVPTADAMILPKGTAHITDVGMCGTLHSSLGIKLDTITTRWRDNVQNINEIETTGPLQFNAVLVESDDKTGLAKTIQPIQKLL